MNLYHEIKLQRRQILRNKELTITLPVRNLIENENYLITNIISDKYKKLIKVTHNIIYKHKKPSIPEIQELKINLTKKYKRSIKIPKNTTILHCCIKLIRYKEVYTEIINLDKKSTNI